MNFKKLLLALAFALNFGPLKALEYKNFYTGAAISVAAGLAIGTKMGYEHKQDDKHSGGYLQIPSAYNIVHLMAATVLMTSMLVGSEQGMIASGSYFAGALIGYNLPEKPEGPSYQEQLKRYLNPDDCFIKDSDALLAKINKHYGKVIENMGTTGIDTFRVFNYDQKEGLHYLGTCAKAYLAEIAKLLQYQPSETNQTFTDCQQQLLKAQKDLEFMVAWITPKRIWLDEAANECYQLYLSDRNDTAKCCNHCKTVLPKHYCFGDLKGLKSKRAYLQEQLDSFLQANDQNVTPKFVEYVLLKMDELEQTIITDPNYVAGKAT